MNVSILKTNKFINSPGEMALMEAIILKIKHSLPVNEWNPKNVTHLEEIVGKKLLL